MGCSRVRPIYQKKEKRRNITGMVDTDKKGGASPELDSLKMTEKRKKE